MIEYFVSVLLEWPHTHMHKGKWKRQREIAQLGEQNKLNKCAQFCIHTTTTNYAMYESFQPKLKLQYKLIIFIAVTRIQYI